MCRISSWQEGVREGLNLLMALASCGLCPSSAVMSGCLGVSVFGWPVSGCLGGHACVWVFGWPCLCLGVWVAMPGLGGHAMPGFMCVREREFVCIFVYVLMHQ